MLDDFEGPTKTIKFIPKRGYEKNRLSYTPEDGEFIYVIDKRTLWIGDGVKPGGWFIGNMPSQVTYIQDYCSRKEKEIAVRARANKIWNCRPWYKRIFL